MATISRLSVSLTANTRKFARGMARAKSTLGSFVGSIFNVKTAVAGLIGGAGIGFLAKNIIDVNARFQTLKSSLKTVTGGTKEASKAFKLIEKFATTTPFDLEQVVGAFIKLKALGLTPSEDALKSYGNTASAMGKSLNQMIEAVADASTGEFERLKEFGIRASSEGDKVTFTFQGISTTVGKNAAEIEGYLQGIGNTTFSGAMEDQMENLTPAFSNFGAALDGLKTKIGEAGINRLVADIAVAMTDFINSIKTTTVKDMTQAVVLFGFSAARAFVNGIVWVGNFIDEFGRMDIVWLNAKKAVIDWGLVFVSGLQIAGNQLIGFLNQAKGGFLALKVSVAEIYLEFQKWTPLLNFISGGLIPKASAEGLTETKLAIISLREEQTKFAAGLGQFSGTAIDETIAKTRGALMNIRSDILNEVEAAKRTAPEISLSARLGNFKESAEGVLKNLELRFLGEDKTEKLPLGEDPLRRKTVEILQSIDQKIGPYAPQTAVAG